MEKSNKWGKPSRISSNFSEHCKSCMLECIEFAISGNAMTRRALHRKIDNRISSNLGIKIYIFHN